MAVVGAEDQFLGIFLFEFQVAGMSKAWVRKTTAKLLQRSAVRR
jgi:hypothetical protein